jgi:hypothetical protein
MLGAGAEDSAPYGVAAGCRRSRTRRTTVCTPIRRVAVAMPPTHISVQRSTQTCSNQATVTF